MSESKIKINYGLELLRMFMCFEVILSHCWSSSKPDYLSVFFVLRNYAVPVFMFMSFFLTYKYIVNINKEYFCKRLKILFWPQLIWAIVYFSFYLIWGYINHIRIIFGKSDLLWQIITGHSLSVNPSMWYQTDLIIITIIFSVVFYRFGEKIGIYILTVFGICCYILQYTGINDSLFRSLRAELSYPLGRLIETIPVAVCGLIVAQKQLKDIISKKYIKVIICIIAITAGIWLDSVTVLKEYSFGYAGAGKIIGACAFVFLFYDINLENEVVKKIVGLITKYTLGIYCIHRLVAFIVAHIFKLEEIHFYQCIFIYIVSYCVCAIIDRTNISIFKKAI